MERQSLQVNCTVHVTAVVVSRVSWYRETADRWPYMADVSGRCYADDLGQLAGQSLPIHLLGRPTGMSEGLYERC